MKKTKVLAIILASLTLVGCMASCTGDGEGQAPAESVVYVPAGTDAEGNVVYETEIVTMPTEPSNPSGGETTQKPANVEVLSFENYNEGMIMYWGTATLEDGTQTYGYGYMNSKGEVVVPPIYENASIFYQGLAAVVKDQEHKGYIDTTGKEVIPCIYKSVTSCFDTLAWVTTAEGVEQMINTKGEVVYTATGRETAKGYYQNGFFWIETKEEKISGDVYTMTYYNEKGEVAFKIEDAQHVQDSKYVDAENLGNSNFNEHGYAIVSVTRPYEYTEGSGKFIPITRNWFVNTKGEIVDFSWDNGNINPDLASVMEIEAGNWYIMELAGPISRGGYSYYIDWDNQTIHRAGFQFDKIEHLGEEYYVFKGGHYTQYSGSTSIVRGYTGKDFVNFRAIEDLGGAKVMSSAYQKIDGKDAFVLFLHSTSEVGYMSVIDFSGNVLVEPVKAWIGDPVYNYEGSSFLVGYTINPICAGLILAQDQDTKLYGYIDLSGNWVIPAKYESATSFDGEGEDAYAIVNDNTIINRKGEVIYQISAGE